MGNALYVANYNSGSMTVVRTADCTVIRTVEVGFSPDGIAVTPNGEHVYVGCYQSIAVTDTVDNRVVRQISSGHCRLTDATGSPSGEHIYMTAYLPTDFPTSGVLIVRTQSDTIEGTIPVSGDPWSIVVSPNGRDAYVAGGAGRFVAVVDLASRQIVTQIPSSSTPVALAVSANGDYVYVACNGGAVERIATGSNSVDHTAILGQDLRDIAVLASGDWVYVSDATSDCVYVLNSTDLSVADSVPVGRRPENLAVHPNDYFVYVGNTEDNTVSVIGQ